MEYKFYENQAEEVKDTSSSKFMAKVFGYMFIGLLITAVVSFGWNFIMQHICYDTNGILTENGSKIVLGTAIASMIGMLIISLLISILSVVRQKAPWFGFILYAIFVGLALTIFLFCGISAVTFAEAFGITSLAFGSMFLIGYFTKTKHNWFTLVACGLGIAILLTSIFWGIFYLISPKTGYLLDWGISIAIIVFSMIVVAADAYNIKRIEDKAPENNNLALFCAFNIYCDFIMIFIRILALLTRSSKR